MDDLLRLITIYEKGNISKKLKMYSDEDEQLNTLYNQLLLNLHTKEEVDDMTVYKALYLKKKASFKSYIKLKERLKEKLTNIILVIDLKEVGFSDRYRFYVYLVKQFLIGRVLLNYNEIKLGEKILNNALKKSIKYEFTDLQLIISKLQASFYGNIIQVPQKYNYYNSIANSSLEELILESQVRKNYNEYYSIRLKALTNFASQTKNMAKYIADAKYAISKSKNSEIRTFSYSMLFNCYIQLKNVEEFEEIARKSLDYFFQNKKIGNEAGKKNCSDIINGCFQLRLFNFSEFISEKYSSIFTEREHNWYSFSYYLILIKIHEKKYATAYSIFSKCYNSAFFKHQVETIQQHFKVLYAYLFFILIDSPSLQSKEKFKLNKFINDVPIFNKEKRGMNISILIIQVAILIIERKYNLLYDRIEALNLYSYRYLRKSEFWRSSCFIKMLVALSKCEFDKKWATARIQPILEKLNSVRIETFPDAIEIEIVPYEELWEMILKRL